MYKRYRREYQVLIKRNIVGLRMVKFTVLDIDKVDAIKLGLEPESRSISFIWILLRQRQKS